MKAKSYMELPSWIKEKKAVTNVKNNSEWVSHYQKHRNYCNFKGIDLQITTHFFIIKDNANIIPGDIKVIPAAREKYIYFYKIR